MCQLSLLCLYIFAESIWHAEHAGTYAYSNNWYVLLDTCGQTINTNLWHLIGYNNYLIPLKYFSNFSSFGNVSLLTQIGFEVNFYMDFLSNNNTVFIVFQCVIVTFTSPFGCKGVSYFLIYSWTKPLKIPTSTVVRNIYRHSFDCDKLLFVLLIVRTICTSKFKHLIVSVMGFEIKNFQKSIYIPAALKENHSWNLSV